MQWKKMQSLFVPQPLNLVCYFSSACLRCLLLLPIHLGGKLPKVAMAEEMALRTGSMDSSVRGDSMRAFELGPRKECVNQMIMEAL